MHFCTCSIRTSRLPEMNVFASGVLLAALLSVLGVTAPAAIIHVPADQPTIQQAINAANNGDLVLVSRGTYLENIDYHGKAISIQSTSGPTQTIIDGNNAGMVVTFQTQEGAQSVLTGFTIQHGNATFGAGVMLLGTSPTLTSKHFPQQHSTVWRIRRCDRREWLFASDRAQHVPG